MYFICKFRGVSLLIATTSSSFCLVILHYGIVADWAQYNCIRKPTVLRKFHFGTEIGVQFCILTNACFFDNYSDERGAILLKPSVNKRQDQIGSIYSASYIRKYIIFYSHRLEGR